MRWNCIFSILVYIESECLWTLIPGIIEVLSKNDLLNVFINTCIACKLHLPSKHLFSFTFRKKSKIQVSLHVKFSFQKNSFSLRWSCSYPVYWSPICRFTEYISQVSAVKLRFLEILNKNVQAPNVCTVFSKVRCLLFVIQCEYNYLFKISLGISALLREYAWISNEWITIGAVLLINAWPAATQALCKIKIS